MRLWRRAGIMAGMTTMTLIGKLTSLFVFPLFLIWFILAVADASATQGSQILGQPAITIAGSTPVNDCDHEQLSCSDFHEPSLTDDPFGGGLGMEGFGSFHHGSQFWG